VGTAFIIWGHDEVLRRLASAHSESVQGTRRRHAGHKESFAWETIKKLQLDRRSFLFIDEKGFITSAGRYLDVDTKSIELEGLGGRHISALAITRETHAIAITVQKAGEQSAFSKDGIETRIEPSADLFMLLP